MSSARFRACVVIQQRERRDLAGAMAFLAVLLEDGGHVAVIRGGLGAAGHRAGPERDPEQKGHAAPPDAARKSWTHPSCDPFGVTSSMMGPGGAPIPEPSEPPGPSLKMIVRQSHPRFQESRGFGAVGRTGLVRPAGIRCERTESVTSMNW